jgi:purine-binding chemotaxis protein CheW
MNVVVRTGDSVVSLLVDQIGDVIEVNDAAFEGPPSTMKGIERSLVRGVYKLEGRLLLVLDTENATDVESTLPTAIGTT